MSLGCCEIQVVKRPHSGSSHGKSKLGVWGDGSRQWCCPVFLKLGLASFLLSGEDAEHSFILDQSLEVVGQFTDDCSSSAASLGWAPRAWLVSGRPFVAGVGLAGGHWCSLNRLACCCQATPQGTPAAPGTGFPLKWSPFLPRNGLSLLISLTPWPTRNQGYHTSPRELSLLPMGN